MKTSRWPQIALFAAALLVIGCTSQAAQRSAPTVAEATAAGSDTTPTSSGQTTAATHQVQIPGTPGPLTLPEGFTISLFAQSLPGGARLMAFSPDGVLHVSIPSSGQIVALPDANNDGVADGVQVVADNLNQPHGLTFHEGALWVANTDSVVRLSEPDAQGKYQKRETIVNDLPVGGGHSSRTLGFGPDGALYVAAGSSCNVCNESDEKRAAITRYNADGSDPQVFARGLRNPVGFIWNDAGELIATNNGRDGMGDDVPPETINITKGGDDFGWPRCHAGDIVDPQFGGSQGCTGVTAPAFKLQAHSAPLGLRIYSGTQFPASYQGDLFVAFHGSWNRSVPTGYKVVQLDMQNNRPVAIDDFITGWLVNGNAWGRPVDVIVGADGSMYISDDELNAVYRVTATDPSQGAQNRVLLPTVFHPQS